MTIEEQLTYLESKIKEDIDKMSHKDRGAYYQGLKEFTRAKLMRGNVIPEGDDKERDITITYVDANSSKSDLS